MTTMILLYLMTEWFGFSLKNSVYVCMCLEIIFKYERNGSAFQTVFDFHFPHLWSEYIMNETNLAFKIL